MARKPLHVADHGLWDEVKRTIKPLRDQPHQHDEVPVAKQGALSGHRIQPTIQQVHRPSYRNAPPPLAGFDRRTSQKLSRGQMEPESVIDLHGESVELARVKLYHYLESRRRDGLRLVLVITGKGASPFARHTLHGVNLFHSPEREGRLRREVPLWLHEDIFRTHVIGYQPSHPRHGGGGAIYVRLRQRGYEQ